MAISREQKVDLIESYIEQLKESRGAILVDYRGLSVSELGTIRDQMRPLGGKFQVIKNRLFLLALQELEHQLPEEWLVGPTAISFCYEDLPPIAKILTDTAKDLENLAVKGGMIEADVVSADQISAIASLPSREVLLAQVLGTINAPASQVLGVVASGIRQVLNVLQAYVDKLEEVENAGVPAEAAAEAA
ncbi:MAG TPA: 50S ribosomal protein L10 [Chloroflexi bacterium]|nr:50S ribosomal protein L10 [Chloroflexota bacterium]